MTNIDEIDEENNQIVFDMQMLSYIEMKPLISSYLKELITKTTRWPRNRRTMEIGGIGEGVEVNNSK